MTPIFSLRNVTKSFHVAEKDLLVLRDIDLDIESGEFFVFVGPSGSGKSTLMRIMSGLDEPTSGEVLWNPDISRENFSFVFQQFALFPWLTVSENIAIGLRAKNVPEAKRKEKVEIWLEKMGLKKFAGSYPRDLSGGMRQRVGIARAFVTEPKIIFMDEPFSELDSFTAEELRKDILKIWLETKITIVMVTHLIEEALEMGDRIAAITPAPARIEKIVVNKLPRPREKRSQEFFALEDRLYSILKP